MTPLPMRLKEAAEDAFHDNSLLTMLSPQERARFLRGQVPRIARRAPDFATEIGYRKTGDKA